MTGRRASASVPTASVVDQPDTEGCGKVTPKAARTPPPIFNAHHPHAVSEFIADRVMPFVVCLALLLLGAAVVVVSEYFSGEA